MNTNGPFITPFKFDITGIVKRARRKAKTRLVGDVTINLPFVSFSVKLDDRERTVAREVVIRLLDRRVLSAYECCDNCIDKALASLQEIRRILVDKQVELSDVRDGPLYLLTDTMLIGIRQFLTYEELLKQNDQLAPHPRFSEFHRPPDVRQAYFDALNLLRDHLSRCIGQVAVIAGIDLPTDGVISWHQGPWKIERYEVPELPADTSR